MKTPAHQDEALPISVRQTIHAIESDLARTWQIKDWASLCRCSSGYLIRSFKKCLGLSPYVYLCRRRAECAALLLMRTQDPISKIGLQVGWPEPSHFSRRFRQYYGESASQFRERTIRGENPVSRIMTPSADGTEQKDLRGRHRISNS